MEGHYHPPKGITFTELKQEKWVDGYKKWKASKI